MTIVNFYPNAARLELARHSCYDVTMDSTASPSIAALVERLTRQLDVTSEVTHDLLRQLGQLSGQRLSLSTADQETIAAQYRRLGAEHPQRHELLRLLTATASAESLTLFSHLMSNDPPSSASGATLAFVPLFQQSAWPVEALFPALLNALEHGAVAGIVLDLSNYLVRQRRVAEHPARMRVAQLAQLLGAMVNRLAQIEERPQDFARTPQALTTLVSEALSLVVSLCDALGLIGDVSVCGKLYQARELKHRRIRVEAAAALARLGDPSGIESLVELAAEPVVRARVLAYLEELHALDKARPEHCTPSATAEGLLAAWLSQPLRYGVGPMMTEIVDQRTQYWPAHEQPVTCFLIRYTMPLGEPPLVGVGLVGPLTTAATHLGLAELSPEMIYAYYAGASVEHEAIVETPVEQLAAAQLTAWVALKPQLDQANFSELRLVAHAQFFEHEHWIAEATHEGQRVVAITDGNSLTWYPLGDGPRDLSTVDWYALHKGRIILETFNPPGR